MTSIRLEEAQPGSVWFRCPSIHPSVEPFGCEIHLQHVGNVRRTTPPIPPEPQTGPWLVMQCYGLISGWWDEPIDKNETGRVRENVERGFCRWYHLVNYGWIHESNLFVFFRRVV